MIKKILLMAVLAISGCHNEPVEDYDFPVGATNIVTDSHKWSEFNYHGRRYLCKKFRNVIVDIGPAVGETK